MLDIPHNAYAGYFEGIMILLAAMKNLRRVSINGQTVRLPQLYMLVLNSGTSLLHLKINFTNEKEWPSSALLKVLSEIRHLQTLGLLFAGTDNVQSTYPSDRILFPHLHTIIYEGVGPWHELGLELLCWMRLPSLHTFSLELPRLSHCAQHLKVFFKNNARLKNLHVGVPQPCADAMFACPIIAKKLSMTFLPPPSQRAKILDEFCYVIIRTTMEHLTKLVEFLDEIALKAVPSHRLKHIQVTLLPQRFLWTSAGRSATPEYSAFVGMMLHHSAVLQSKGIGLLDENGCQVSLKIVDQI